MKTIRTILLLVVLLCTPACSGKKTEISYVTNAVPEETILPTPDPLEQLEYEISDNKVKIKRVKSGTDYIEIQPFYNVEGATYQTDTSELTLSNLGLKTVVFQEGIHEVPNHVFNGGSVQRVYIPKSMTCVYDTFLSYLHPDDGKKIEIFYAGDQSEWDTVFTIYKPQNVTLSNSSPEEIGSSWAYKVNNWFGAVYDPDQFLYYYNIDLQKMRALCNR